MAKMTKDQAALVLRKLENFEKLERKATDEAGWIALHFGVSRPVAIRMIALAHSFGEEASDG